MASLAKQDQAKRIVKVNRLELITVLKSNKIKHVKDYDEALAGYKSVLASKLEAAFREAQVTLETCYQQARARVDGLTDADIVKQSDQVTLLDGIYVEMSVPRSYAEEYDAAIALFEWDVRTEVELTHAEFTCFVRDRWDWSLSFATISSLYKSL